jgi:hypothetical protein
MKNRMLKMSLSTGGRTYRLVSEQARRISACRLTFFTERAGAGHRHNGPSSGTRSRSWVGLTKTSRRFGKIRFDSMKDSGKA